MSPALPSGLGALLALGPALAAQAPQAPDTAAAARRREGLQAFTQISAVLLHPRCLNCHTNGDHPTQGDDRHPHLFRVVRGDANTGAAGLHCATCHQTFNNPTTGVPGAAGWELAPVSMGWEERTPRGLCEQLQDPTRNGGLDRPGLARHFATDARVAWGWSPGDGRAIVSTPKETFLAAVSTWLARGAPCPD